MGLRFWKLQAIGNDFPLVHLDDVAAIVPAGGSLDFELARLAALMSDRHFGVGGDGLLAVGREGDAVRLRMFNPDGTEDFCGNGLRIAARHALDAGWVGERFVLKHLDRDVATEVRPDGRIATVLGAATYDPERVPTTAPGELFDTHLWSGMDAGMPMTFQGSALSTGSTHSVIPTYALPDDDSFRSVSSKIETDGRFPQRTSVIWSREVAPKVLEIRIWERGVGETLGCGTGSSAAAVDYARRKGVSGPIEVRNPGGTVTVEFERWDLPLAVVGEAEALYEGEYLVAGDPTAR